MGISVVKQIPLFPLIFHVFLWFPMFSYVVLCVSHGFPATNRLKTTPAYQVLAAEGFGGQGGGQSAWPPLLKRQLLGAKDEPEVAATQAWLGGHPILFWEG